LAIKSKGKGKSGGARIITFVVAVKEEVVLLSIFDKSESENISDQELDKLLRNIINQNIIKKSRSLRDFFIPL
jgi:hypothetical protein